MSTNLEFSLLSFESLTWEEWKRRYRRDIRIILDCTRIKPKEMYLHLVDKIDDEGVIHGVWYEEGKDWMDGDPIPIKPGNNMCLVRVPAFEYKHNILVVDGMHRIKELEPAMILLDVVKIGKNSRRYVFDFFSPFWEKL